MSKGFITLTVVFEGMSLNRDEGMGNIQTLHLLHRGNGKTYSYMSRQALTYAVRKKMLEIGKNDDQYSPYLKECPVAGDSSVNQWVPLINLYFEPDLFGYMVTTDDGSITRPAPVTFTHAVSMEPYEADTAFYANHEMVRRRGDATPNPYVRQEHLSLYKYSIVIDLNRIGNEENNEVWVKGLSTEKVERILRDFGINDINTNDNTVSWNDDNNIELNGDSIDLTILKGYRMREENGEEIEQNKVNKKRIEALTSSIFYLSHQISGKNEPLYPIFVAAAHIKYGTPIFHNYVELGGIRKKKENEKDAGIYEYYLGEELFKNGIKKVNKKNILISNHLVWGIEKGAGYAHLTINDEEIPHKEDSINDVEDKIKKWIENIYKRENNDNDNS